MKSIPDHEGPRFPGYPVAPNKPLPSDLKSAFERMDLIHSEFERCKRLGLPYPSLRELDRLVGPLRARDIENAKKWQKDNPIRYSYGNTKRSAKKRGYEWEVSPERFEALVLGDCVYCGAKPNPIHGVDRIDNDLGYIAGNIATACEICNYAKRKMAVPDFIDWARKLVSYNQE